MIFVKLMGGLGNQMFQYAAARRLALQHGTEVVFDPSYFDYCSPEGVPRQYELDHFCVNGRIATPLEVAEKSGFCESWLLRLKIMINRVFGTGTKLNLYKEEQNCFCKEVLSLPDDVYLSGYWQSERYFSDIAGILREEFRVRTALDGVNKEISAQICTTDSVAVHFRRGDYVTSTKTAAFHGNLTEAYYLRAIEELCRIVSSPHLYIFSDEPDWVRHEMTFPVPATIVDHNPPERGYEDLRLMSSCRHAIIANSSFSWWGAWLINNPNKVVVAPQQWFNDNSNNIPDLIPSGWLLVDVA